MTPIEFEQFEKEFSGAFEIIKFEKFALTETGIFFRLKRADGGDVRMFADRQVTAKVAEELHDLARANGWIESGGEFRDFFPSNPRELVPIGTDDRIAPYYGSSMKVMRATLHMDAIGLLLETTARNSILVATKLEGEPTRFRLDILPKPPASLAMIIGDAVHNLRCALDVLIEDVARVRGVAVERLDFPFAKRKKDLKHGLDRLRKIDPALADLVEGLGPYEQGDPDLYGLHRLDIIDKHTAVCPAFVATLHGMDYQGIVDATALEKGATPPRIFVVEDDSGHTGIRDGEIIDSANGKSPIEFLRKEPSNLVARFPGKDHPFPNEDVLPTLSRLGQVVQKICRDMINKYPAS